MTDENTEDAYGDRIAPNFRPGDRVGDPDHTGRVYAIKKYIGKGGFAECYSACLSTPGQATMDVALKVVEKRRMKDANETKIMREFRLHLQCRHRNIVRLFDGFCDNDRYYLAMELCRRENLLSLINYSHVKHHEFADEDGCRITLDILSAMSYLLQCGILHRDIKPGNVFIGQDGTAKLGDFGLAVRIADLNPSSVSGTPNYLAPEVLDKRGHSEASEVWSLACLVYCMMVGLPPFETKTIDETYERIRRCDYKFPKTSNLSYGARTLIERCLVATKYERPAIAILLGLHWFRCNQLNKGCSCKYQHASRSTSDSLTSSQGSSVELLMHPNPLMRARSIGDMRLYHQHQRAMESNNSNYGRLPMRINRPKSAMLDFDHEEKAQRMGSRDSGFGSESEITKRPLLAEKLTRIMYHIKCVTTGSFFLDRAVPDLYVTKWVDYTNRRGFACILSDGSMCIKFNEGSCISWPRYGDFFLYAVQPFSTPRVLSINDELSAAEREHVATALEYRDYMDRELANESPCSYVPIKPVSELPLLAYSLYQKQFLIMIFTNGTIQVNFLHKKKMKVVLSVDDQVDGDSSVNVSFVGRDWPPLAYSINRKVRRPRQDVYVPWDLYTVLDEVHDSLQENCDLLHPSMSPMRKRVQVTTC